MAAAYCFTFSPLKSSKPKLSLYGVSLGHQCRSSKILSLSHFENKDFTESDLVSHDVIRRPTFDFTPSIWGDQFISSSSSGLKPDMQTQDKIEGLKLEIQNILCSAVSNSSQQLVFIDKIQRLSVAYHFEEEISNALHHTYENASAHQDDNLDMVALRFRLLRQAGLFVSPGVFSNFMDGKGEFLESLKHDLQGLLSLYEAAHLGCKGETILDKAIIFSTKHLKCLARELNLDCTSEVRRALQLPLRKRIPRVEATYHMSLYHDDPDNDVLLQFAKLDFNALQLTHRAELSQLSRWWKETSIISNLPFKARDRLVEVYAIIAGTLPEPQYSFGRAFNTKYMVLFTVVDDIFDAYGTLPELQLIADAISSWDVKDIHGLPEYAKGIVLEMHNIFNEIDDYMVTKGLEFGLPYFQKQAQNYIRCLLDEAKLFHSKKVPTLQEWWQISEITIGGKFMPTGYTLAYWDILTKEAMDWSVSQTQGNHSCARCCRIIGDVTTFKLEQKRGNAASSVSCYMKEHMVDEHEAIENLRKMIDEGWKEMNQQCLNPTTIPLRFLMAPIITLRTMEFCYMYDDGYTYSGGHVEEMINSLIVKHVPV